MFIHPVLTTAACSHQLSTSILWFAYILADSRHHSIENDLTPSNMVEKPKDADNSNTTHQTTGKGANRLFVFTRVGHGQLMGNEPPPKPPPNRNQKRNAAVLLMRAKIVRRKVLSEMDLLKTEDFQYSPSPPITSEESHLRQLYGSLLLWKITS